MKEHTGIIGKFFLLLWKNWVLQKRHPIKTALEIFIPILMVIIMAIMRSQTDPWFKPYPIYYESLPLDKFPVELRPKFPFELLNDVDIESIDTEILYNEDMRSRGEEEWEEKIREWIEEMMSHLNETVWPVAYTPQTSLTYSIMSQVEERISVEAAEYGFESEEDMVEFLMSNDTFLCGVVFDNIDDTLPDNVKITIRMPATPRVSKDGEDGWHTDILFQLYDDARPRNGNKSSGGGPGYYDDGFLAVQHALSMTVLQTRIDFEEGGRGEISNGENVTVEMNRFTYPPYTYDKMQSTVQFFLSGVFLLGFVYPCIEIAKSVTYEKEKRLKESMKMMGLPNWLHWSAWFTKYILLLTIPVVVMPVLLCVRAGDDVKKIATLEHSSFWVILVFIIVFAVTTIAFAFMVSAFFSKANASATGAGILWLLCYCPYYFLQPRYLSLSKSIKLVSGVLHVTNMALLCQIISISESSAVGVTFDNINEYASHDDNVTFAELLGLMVGDAVLYMLVTWYVEAVFPGEFGIAQPFYFPFTKRYWFPECVYTDDTIEVSEPSDRENRDLFEREPRKAIGVLIQGLTKMYRKGQKLAVDNLRLNMYEGQITALLGHNGAGKTTTMSMLTGLFPPTAGTAVVNGYDIVKDINLVRSSLGLCPQHDVLFDELTCEEHLYFFCKLKGMTSELVDLQIDYFLTNLDIENKRYKEARTLSGGMKRKLCVAVALCGGSKVVMLDEPTSGMDPQARRCTWDLLLNEREGRTILLSTHFMEEADLLGDRIAIMSAGKVHCCGSSLFLKKKFGAGYHLVMVKEKGCDIQKVIAMVQSHVPTAELHQNVGAELAVILPDEASSYFPEMFEQLESDKSRLRIMSYGLSHTTMEEVFIRVGERTDERLKQQLAAINNQGRYGSRTDLDSVSDAASQDNVISSDEAVSPQVPFSSLEMDSTRPQTDGKLQHYEPKLWQQIYSQMVKKFLYTIRNWKLCLIQILAPLIYVTLAILIAVTQPSLSNPVALPLTLDEYSSSVSLLCARPAYDDKKGNQKLEQLKQNYTRIIEEHGEAHVVEDIRQEEGTTYMSNYTWARSMDFPLGEYNRMYLVGSQFFIDEDNVLARAWFNNEPFHSPSLSLSLLDSTLMRYYTGRPNVNISFTNHPLPVTDEQQANAVATGQEVGYTFAFNLAFGMSFMAASFVLIIIRENATKAKHLQMVAGLGFFRYWLANFLYDFCLYLSCCLVLLGILAAFQQEGMCEREQLGRFLVIFLCYGISMLPQMYIFSFMFSVPSMGFVVVAIINVITGMGTLMTIGMLKAQDKDSADFIATILDWIFLLFPNYALSSAIEDVYINFWSVETCHEKVNTEWKEKLLNFTCTHNLFENACCTDYGGNCGKNGCAQEYFFALAKSGAGREILFLCCSSVIFFGILIMIETKALQRLKYWLKNLNHQTKLPVNHEDVEEDEDVYEERVRVTEGTDSYHLRLLNLTKYYGGDFLAVDHLCLGVAGQECFGLLGVNGAGKTTTFKMLTGDEIITTGDAFVEGYSCAMQIKKVQQHLGYCPQFDAILGQMTGYENLQLFCRLHGVEERNIDHVIHSLAKDFYFEDHLFKYSKDYSGGNKRKLSTAIALVGRPGIVFLDEPTSGMDPVARRLLWDAISKVRDAGTSIVLTSHSMDECEALCTRLAIMVNGRFQCLGSTQYLKSKFGQGYTIIVRIGSKELPPPFERVSMKRKSTFRPGHRRGISGVSNISTHTLAGGRKYSTFSIRNRTMSMTSRVSRIATERETEQLKTFIETSFPGALLKDCHQGMVHYQIANPDITWAEIFRTLEDNKEAYNIEDYSVGQTTLEQVFLGFAKKQRNEENPS